MRSADPPRARAIVLAVTLMLAAVAAPLNPLGRPTGGSVPRRSQAGAEGAGTPKVAETPEMVPLKSHGDGDFRMR